jgi:hypothetical protein
LFVCDVLNLFLSLANEMDSSSYEIIENFL